jgi:hypothetical protein
VLNGLLGTSVSLSAMDYNGLVGANVDLFAFLDALAAIKPDDIVKRGHVKLIERAP